MIKAKIFLDAKQDKHFNRLGVYADVNSKIAEWMEEYKNIAVENLSLSGVVTSLPSKDAMICEGYNKAKNEDYKNRNSLRHKSQDDYYSGWMDCYDFIANKG